MLSYLIVLTSTKAWIFPLRFSTFLTFGYKIRCNRNEASLYPCLAVAVSTPGLLAVTVSMPRLLVVAVSTPSHRCMHAWKIGGRNCNAISTLSSPLSLSFSFYLFPPTTLLLVAIIILYANSISFILMGSNISTCLVCDLDEDILWDFVP